MREERKYASSLGFAFSRDHASEYGLAGALFRRLMERLLTPPGVPLYSVDLRRVGS